MRVFYWVDHHGSNFGRLIDRADWSGPGAMAFPRFAATVLPCRLISPSPRVMGAKNVTKRPFEAKRHYRSIPLTNSDHWGVLMRAALAGNAVAYEALLSELGRSLRVYVRNLLSRSGHGNADVEDVVQETLLAVHLKRGSWNPELPFAPWVNAIVRYKVIDALRRQGRRVSVPIDALAETLSAPESVSEDASDVDRLLHRLPARQHKIVRAISIEGKTPTEVGLALGLSEGNVRVILHRALKHLAAGLRSKKS